MAVAECRHFGRAAAQCGVSQPALSAQVRKLEVLLGVAVFERAPRRVLVTRRGEALLDAARGVLAGARALLDAARDDRTPLEGPFHLGAIPTLGPYLLPHVLRPMRDAYPAMRPVLSEDRTAGLLAALHAGALDAVLACLPCSDASLDAHPLFLEPFLLTHLAGVAPAWPLRDDADGVLLMAEGHCLNDQTLAACGPEAPRASRHATGLEMLRHMVAAGEGVALMPALAAESLGTIGGMIAYTDPQETVLGREVALVVRRSDPRGPHLAALAALLRGLAPPPARPLGPG